MTIEAHNPRETEAAFAKAKAEGRRVIRMARGESNAAWTLTLSEQSAQPEVQRELIPIAIPYERVPKGIAFTRSTESAAESSRRCSTGKGCRERV